MRNPSQRLPPPGGFANYPRPASLAGITELGENAPRNHSNCEGKRTSHQSAPQFVARVTMMHPYFIAGLPGVMVTDRKDGRKKHVITRRHTLQGVVRLFIHVEESRLKPGQLEISGSAQDRAGVSKRTRRMFQAKVCLCERFGIFICALGKMEYRQFGPLFKRWHDARQTI